MQPEIEEAVKSLNDKFYDYKWFVFVSHDGEEIIVYKHKDYQVTVNLKYWQGYKVKIIECSGIIPH